MGTMIMPDNMSLQFDYYYGNEAEQFTFIRIPKVLLKDKRFSRLSSDAKLLYGILLDRMQLSIRNQWIDEQNRVYIIYRITEIMEDFGYSNKKAGEMLNELHKFGIIEKVRRGQGKPDLIYVKNFVQKQENLSYLADKPEETEKIEEPQTQAESRDFQKCKIYTSRNVENGTSRSVDFTLQEMANLHFKTCKNYTQNNTDIDNININNTDISIHPSISLQETTSPVSEMTDEVGGYIRQYRELIRQNIEYDALRIQPGLLEYEKNLIEELYEIICDVVCIPREKVMGYPYELVKAQFLKLTGRHIKYVLLCMKENTSDIKNVRNYLITALINAEQTMNHYYQSEVNRIKDMGKTMEKEKERNYHGRVLPGLEKLCPELRIGDDYA